MQDSGFRWRLYTSLALLLVYLGFTVVFHMFQDPLVGALAANQVNDSAMDYAVTHSGVQVALTALFWGLVALLAGIWGSYVVKRFKGVGTSLLLCSIAAGAATGCMAPPEVRPLVEIKANQTCYLVPLVGATKGNQKAFMSVEFLNEHKIAAKRVEVPVVAHQIGRFSHAIEWVPAMTVICTDRTPVTREWTKTGVTGTSRSDQAISVESSESINFKLGVTITAVITEEGTAAFQYSYAGKPLSAILDENVRGFVMSYLSSAFGKLSLDQARQKKAEVFEQLTVAVRKEFTDKGITIENVGSSEGLAYDDPGVQDSINKAWTAQRDLERAETERKTALIQADKDAQAVVIRADGEAKANRSIQSSLTGDILKLRSIEKWDGHMPKVTGGATPLVSLQE